MGKRQRRTGPFSGLSQFVQQTFGTATPEKANEDSEPPTKKLRLDSDTKSEPTPGSALALANCATDPTWIDAYDATGLVPRFSSADDVPEHLQKYFSQRKRFFSLYSTPPGCLLDEEGWFSVTPERVADQIAERCRCDTVLDAFCGVGGNAIAFAKTCQRVIALDTSLTRLKLARHNAQIYGVADRIEFILADYIDFAKAFTTAKSTKLNESAATRKIDVVFLSPPWGGPSYISGESRPASPTKQIQSDPGAPPPVEAHPVFSLSAVQPVHGAELFRLSRKITHNIAYYLPRNTDLNEVGALIKDEGKEAVEVEEEWMGQKLKALTCYFGGLAGGQEEMF